MFGITHNKQTGADPRIASALEAAEVKYQTDEMEARLSGRDDF